MAKILLIDFDEAEREHLASQKYDVELAVTGWRSGSREALRIPAEAEVVFYKTTAYPENGGPELHAELRETVAGLVEKGLKVVCFVGGGELHQLTNIVGNEAGLDSLEGARSESVLFNPKALFHVPFERFKPFLTQVYKVYPDTPGEGVWEARASGNGKLEFLAKSADGHPVALLMKKGRGYILLLPSFGEGNAEIMDYILRDKSGFGEDLAESPAPDWIDSEDYVFPEMKALLARKDEERERHETAMAEIDRQVRELQAGGRESFHNLLKAEGRDLKQAVVSAFRYLGWGRVVDVDDYWKKVIRNKEEDIWLIDSEDRPVEVSMRTENLILVLVRDGKNWATDDECALLQRFKGRRMQEFDNTKMKAVLVGNYFSETDPKLRGNPFSAIQTDEALKDGNGLLTSFELFRAVKAEKEKRITKEAVRAQLKEKSGLLTFDL